MLYDISTLQDRKPTLSLSIIEPVEDWGYTNEHEIAPEQVPYLCELTAVWQGLTIDNAIIVSTHGLIYAQADKENQNKFKRWDFSRFEVDDLSNADNYALGSKQGNVQGFELDCPDFYENYKAISQTAADILEEITKKLNSYDINIFYQNGILPLIGFEM